MRDSEIPTKAIGGASELTLPARLDLTAAGPLQDALLSHRGAALNVDAGAVEHLDTPCLQVLLAAAAEWRALRQHLDVTPMSEAFRDALRSFGLTPPDLAAHGSGEINVAGTCTSWA
ncbi:STAS domain-containing protein [Defluviimonas salinarum]|uniref:STAS domain-containing protein n=1 Tax=Defluviimonas salinarum TaxID=2992147 RepID=A0ABT3IXH1_9RHOB|nr:STAS domain-containing protein [Defluviimonas salinarum]